MFEINNVGVDCLPWAPDTQGFPLAECWRVCLRSPKILRGSEAGQGGVHMCSRQAGRQQFVSVPCCQRNTQRMRLLLHLPNNGIAA